MVLDYKVLCIDVSESLRTAMKLIDKASHKILFVTKNDRLVASLTDGDIRRFLLAGGTMEDTAFSAGLKTPHTAKNRAEAEKVLDKHNFVAVPIVSDSGKVLDIIFNNKQEDIIYPQLGIPVVIMAGGKGTRLDPYTRVLPKPLIPVGDLPIIEHIMQRFMKYGCNDFYIIVNHKKQLIKAYFSENEQNYQTYFFDENKPLGTGGGLAMLKGVLKGTFFLTNCDILLMSDFEDILSFHKEKNNLVTMVCAYKNVTIPYGVIEAGENGEIIAMKEKPEFSFQTNTGMYLVEPDLLDDIVPDVAIGFPDIIAQQQQKGQRVAAYPVSESDWLDMGQLAELDKMRIRLYGE